MRIAIVTGASSGLGREFVKQIIQKKRLDAVWVIARRESRLLEMAQGSPVPILPIPLDLTKQESFSALRALLEEEKPDIRILVNAAGFGKIGSYAEISISDSESMINLNCRALVQMTLLVLPYMTRGAQILEVCSVASFQPLPALNVYAASKAFVQSYSRSLRWELFGRGIHVTAVCPYWIKDTEFISIAEKTDHPKGVRHFPLASCAHGVVRAALRDGKLNLPVSTPGPVAFLQRFFTKFIPHELVIACWEGLRHL
ncbi:MAG: SDR family NAD(P)-dependent oxidoreductase [Intestinimonas sp.]|jgi:short-subunit dehydrogenase|nr:SDR family NAD(P)-dependent oxidoreductase [Intestinimonas sp.]